MMLITAVVVPDRLAAIRRALRLFDARGLTVSKAFVRGGSGRLDQSRVRLELLASNADTPDLARIVARTAAQGDLLWVTRVDLLVRIRTGESGLAAL